jgi:hypothetical protein
MATFTRIAEGKTPSINVDVSRRLSKIGTFFKNGVRNLAYSSIR